MKADRQPVWFDLNAALLKIALYAGWEQDSQEDLILDRLAITVGQLHDRMNPMGVSYPDPEEPVKSSFSESMGQSGFWPEQAWYPPGIPDQDTMISSLGRTRQQKNLQPQIT
ncbi:MAG: hypothetical protein KGI54_08975 [Pseudomonadota bacterium]|nr:hypothetical protein [Pseudomonadota bacterium]